MSGVTRQGRQTGFLTRGRIAMFFDSLEKTKKDMAFKLFLFFNALIVMGHLKVSNDKEKYEKQIDKYETLHLICQIISCCLFFFAVT